jgi:hypothetical protein
MDAVTKLSHWFTSGSASRFIPPRLSQFFGPVNQRIDEAFASGRLNLESTIQAGSADGPEADDSSCNIRCGRSNASAKNDSVDRYGVVGAVCMHGVPLRELFCDMPTPEQYSYYLHMLNHLVQRCDNIGDVYIDFGCQFKKAWKRYYDAHPYLPQHARDLRILVNWLHGSGHSLSCEVVNSGRYTVDAGRAVGEQMEQLFSETKV